MTFTYKLFKNKLNIVKNTKSWTCKESGSENIYHLLNE